MKLKALDQVHISAVKADSLRRGETFNVSDALGAELLAKHPSLFERLDAAKAAPKPKNMAAPKPRNKAAAKPANK